MPNKKPKQVLCVDGLNFLDFFGGRSAKQWKQLKTVKKRVASFVAVASKDFQIFMFFDAATKSDEAINKWRSRREIEVKSRKRSVHQSISLLIGEAFRLQNVPVLYSHDADCDDTIASYAYHYNGYIVSADNDMFRYRNCHAPVFEKFRIDHAKNRLKLIPHRNTKKPSRVGKRDVITPVPKTCSNNLEQNIWKHNLRYIRGSPSPLTRDFGNLHRAVRPLRQALYAHLGMESVFESFPDWDAAAAAVEWIDGYVEADNTLNHLLTAPQAAYDHFFANQQKPDNIANYSWKNHLMAQKCVIMELICVYTNQNLIENLIGDLPIKLEILPKSTSPGAPIPPIPTKKVDIKQNEETNNSKQKWVPMEPNEKSEKHEKNTTPTTSLILPVIKTKLPQTKKTEAKREPPQTKPKELEIPFQNTQPLSRVSGVLPILEHKKVIMNAIQRLPIVIIHGETGCGKSSQVPQFLLANKKAKVVVSQPRRIAAISLAKRVASEQNSELGKKVGYSIGNDSISDQNTPLLFTTTGWLLRKILHNKEFFDSCSHVILDEIHERSLDGDLLNVVIREYLEFNMKIGAKSPKIILMSATFDADLFSNYFGQILPEKQKPPTLFVGVKRYPVEIFHLDELNKSSDLGMLELKKKNFNPRRPHDHVTNFTQLICQIIFRLIEKHMSDNEGNCVLVFLPGLAEIDEVFEIIESVVIDDVRPNLELIVLHSSIEQEEQLKCFDSIDPGTTRVILSTNIAESSVTIPQVRYVIDLGLSKTVEYHPQTKLSILQTSWISQAAAKQRSGRCGRLFPGTAFRLFPSSYLNEMDDFEVPEMLRLSLASVVLQLKLIDESTENFKFLSARTLLQRSLQPPTDHAINLAIENLFSSGALDNVNNDHPDVDTLDSSDLTHLGRFVAQLPFDIRHSKLIALGARSGKFLVHCIVIVCGLSLADLFIIPSRYHMNFAELLQSNYNAQKGKARYEEDFSDLLMILRIFTAFVAGKPLLKYNLNMRRVNQLHRTTSEITKRLIPILPNHSRYTKFFGLSKQQQLKQLQLKPQDIDFLRLMIVQAFGDEGFTVGAVKVKDSLPLSPNLPITSKTVELGNTALLLKLPVELSNEKFFKDSFYQLQGQIKSFHKSTLISQPKKQSDAPSTTIAVEFAANQNEPEMDGFRCSSFGLQTLRAMFNRGVLQIPVVDHPEVTAFSINGSQFNTTITWKLWGTQLLRSNTSVLCKFYGKTEMNKTTCFAVSTDVTLAGTTNDSYCARASRMTLLPQENGFFQFCCLSVFRFESLTVQETKILGCEPGEEEFSILHRNASPVVFNIPVDLDVFESQSYEDFETVLEQILSEDVSLPPCRDYSPDGLAKILKGLMGGKDAQKEKPKANLKAKSKKEKKGGNLAHTPVDVPNATLVHKKGYFSKGVGKKLLLVRIKLQLLEIKSFIHCSNNPLVTTDFYQRGELILNLAIKRQPDLMKELKNKASQVSPHLELLIMTTFIKKQRITIDPIISSRSGEEWILLIAGKILAKTKQLTMKNLAAYVMDIIGQKHFTQFIAEVPFQATIAQCKKFYINKEIVMIARNKKPEKK